MVILDVNNSIKSFIKDFNLEYIARVLDVPQFKEHTIGLDIVIVHSSLLSDDDVFTKLNETAGWFSCGENIEGNITGNNYLGHIDANSNAQIQANIIQSFTCLIDKSLDLKSSLIKLNTEMDNVVSNVELELLRIKKLYERSAPKRFDYLKGLTYISKYAAGESSGGEFFDAIKVDSKLLVLMSSCDSYLTSSCILNLFANLKDEASLDKSIINSFVEEVVNEVNVLSDGGKEEIDCNLLVCMLDFKSFEISGNIFGSFDVCSSNSKHIYKGNTLKINKKNIEKSLFEMHLQRKERLLLMSPGFKINWGSGKQEINLDEVISDEDIKPNDLLDELFFQMKKDVKSGFLKHDASAIMLEVDQNVMLEI